MVKKEFYFICLLSSLLLSGCAERSFKKSALLLGTEVEITVFAKNPEKARRAIDLALEKIKKEERNLSYYRKESELSKINKSAGEWVKGSPELFFLIKESLRYGKLTDGAFNIAISPLKSSSLCNYKKIAVDEKQKRIRLQRGMALDLGGIAKGYIVDETVKLLQKEGIRNGVVNAGGDLRVFGGRSYRIAIRDPFNKLGLINQATTDSIVVAPFMEQNFEIPYDRVFKVIKVKNKAVCTSGVYERPGHILNPKTGEPVSDTLRSVTIIASSATCADTLATAVMVMGRKKGEEFLQKLNSSYLLIDSEGKVFYSNDLGNKRG